MKPTKTLVAADRQAWRAWLAANHETGNGIWLVYFKKTGQKKTKSARAGARERGVAYEDSVEEALCFGWIDSLIKKVDETKYVRLFTPRRDDQNWSPSNRKRVAKLLAEGRMTPAGEAKAGFLRASVRVVAPKKRSAPAAPDHLKAALAASKPAWENYNRLAPSYQRQYIGWIMGAKKDETRRRRLAEVVALLAQGRKLGLK